MKLEINDSEIMNFYRADCWTSISFVSCNYVHYKVNIFYIEFELLKETPCGYWIKHKEDDIFTMLERSKNKKIWVSKAGKNRIAYPTKKQALFNFYKRRERYIKILESKLNEQKQVIIKIKKEMERIGYDSKTSIENIKAFGE